MSDALQRLQGLGPRWQAIRDLKVRKMVLQAAIELRRLAAEAKALQSKLSDVAEEINRRGISWARLRQGRYRARWLGVLTAGAVGLTGLGAWWSVSWFESLGALEKLLIVVPICVLPLIGGMAFFRHARPSPWFRAGLGLVVLLCGVAGGGVMAISRNSSVGLMEERRAAAARISDELDAAPGVEERVPRVERTKWLHSVAMFLAALLLTVGGEIAAALTYDAYLRLSTALHPVRVLYERSDELGRQLAENEDRQEAVRRSPQLLYLDLTIEGLGEEEAAARAVAEAERRAEEEARRVAERDRERASLGFLVRRILLGFAVVLLVILSLATLVLAAERSRTVTIVILDCSQSIAPDEFARNTRAVEGVILRVDAGEQVSVLGLTKRSFSEPVLLRESAPQSAGRFGEYLDAWRSRVVAKWRKTAAGLRPAAAGSDVFGAIARAKEELGSPAGRRRLILLSDLRHVGRGFDFEHAAEPNATTVHRAEREAVLPALPGVEVWALGVHTVGVDERQWHRLKAFWTEYFRRAGAQLRGFSPSRRLTE